MCCQIELRKSGSTTIVCGLATFNQCSQCRKEICVSHMGSCCLLSYCTACERQHFIVKHHGSRTAAGRTRSSFPGQFELSQSPVSPVGKGIGSSNRQCPRDATSKYETTPGRRTRTV